jgi:hypothetical protein
MAVTASHVKQLMDRVEARRRKLEGKRAEGVESRALHHQPTAADPYRMPLADHPEAARVDLGNIFDHIASDMEAVLEETA